MNQGTSKTDHLSEIDRRIDFVAEELYEPRGKAGQIDFELCPLFRSISEITDRYQDAQLIGRGGMKEVCRVFDAKTTRHVALARPLPKYSHEHFDAFLREAHVTARLEHPCIIDLYDMGVGQDGRPFFTMEFKQGRSLRHLISEHQNGRAKNPLPLNSRLDFFQRICEAIAYAHSRRVLHLDIKPANIQVGEPGEVWVCDWGLGVVMRKKERLDDSATLLDPDLYGPLLVGIKGTPEYMAPEQRDQRAQKTPQMDIYALGCVLFELVTFRSFNNHAAELSGVDSALAAIIRKATAAQPHERYGGVDRLLDDVVRYKSDLSISAQQRSLLREAALFWRRHRETCSAIASAFAIICLCVVLFFNRLQDEKRFAMEAQAQAEASRQDADRERAVALLAKGEAESARLEAEESLSKYLQKKVEATQLLREQGNAAVAIVCHATSATMKDQRAFVKTIKVALTKFHQLCEKDPPKNSRVWNNRFWLLFLVQDFSSAVEILEQGKVVDRDLAKLALDFVGKTKGRKFLQADDFSQLLNELTSGKGFRRALAERMLVYDGEHPRPTEDRVRLIEQWIRSNNGNSKNIHLEYDPNNSAMRITGPMRLLVRSGPKATAATWSMTVSALQTLPPLRLDLRDTKFEELRQLEEVQLFELDLRGTAVRNFEPLSQMRTLRRIYLDAEQLAVAQLQNLPPWVDILSEETE